MPNLDINRRFGRREAVLLFGASLLALALLETGLALLVARGLLLIDRPSYSLSNARSEFWVDMDPDFGVWHRPGSNYRHIRSCYDVRYSANSHGMRDRPRALRSRAPRVAVLGDSFIEGHGVPDGARMTDRLESMTSLEHLNFGTSGNFGSTQYWLQYRKLVSRFDHDGVILGIFPGNDFSEDDLAYGREVLPNRYRPYLTGEYPEYDLVYFKDLLDTKARPGPLRMGKNILREFSYTYRALWFLTRLSHIRSTQAKARETAAKAAETHGSGGYEKFSERQFLRMRYAIERIKEIAGTRRLLIVTIPDKSDLVAYNPGNTPPLVNRLKTLARRLGAEYMDLLVAFHQRNEPAESFYLPCDGHLSAQGHAAAAEAIRKQWSYYGKHFAP